MKIIVTEINVQTGEEITFERDETAQEKTSRLETKAKNDAKQAEEEAESQIKAVLLSKLGITEEEARILLG